MISPKNEVSRKPVDETKLSKPNAFSIDEIVILTANGSNINITNQWFALELCEDLFSTSISGTLMVEDSHNFLRHGPIIGQEQIRISFMTPGVGSERITKFFRIYKVGQRDLKENGKVQTYKLHFISNETVINSQDKCNYALEEKTVEEMITTIFSKHFPDSNIEIKAGTKNTHTFVLPNRNPFSCINWLTKRAISSDNVNDCSFVFYQDLDGFKFDTVVNMLKRSPKQKYDYTLQNLRNEISTFRNVHESFTTPDKMYFENTSDKLNEIQNGMYSSSIFLHDLTTKTYTAKTYDYFEHFNALFEGENENPILAQTEQEKSNERPQTMINYYPKSSGSVGSPTLDGINENAFDSHNNDIYEQWVLFRESLEQQIQTHKIILTIPGDSRRRVGEMVHFTFPSPQPQRNIDLESFDNYVSGKYLITSIKHYMTRLDYKTNLELSRNFFPTQLPTKAE